jgi:DNA-binding response OmpR family regulator
MVEPGVSLMAGTQKKILVVEDLPESADLFAEMLKLNGFEVLKSAHSKTAMDMAKQHKPDAIILDIMMPDVSGLEVLRFVRNTPSIEKTPVIVVTSKGLPSDIETGYEAGATEYLTKPVSYDELKRAVDSVLTGMGG